MIQKGKSEIIKEVKILLDENETSTALDSFGDYEQLQTDDIIEEVMLLALDRVYQMAPSDMMKGVGVNAVKTDGSNIDNTDNYCTKISISEDYQRILYVRLGAWQRGVENFTGVEDDEYAMFRSRYAGVRPTNLHPAAAITKNLSGNVILECYPKDSTASSTVSGTTSHFPAAQSKGAYVEIIPKSSFDGAGDSQSLSIADACYQAYLYTVASLYYVTLGDDGRAKMMADEARESLNLTKTQEQ